MGRKIVLAPGPRAVPHHHAGRDQGIAPAEDAALAEGDGVPDPPSPARKANDVGGTQIGQGVDLDPLGVEWPRLEIGILGGEGGVEVGRRPVDQLVHQLRRRLRERLAPDQPALAPAGLVGGEEGTEHRTAERRVAGCGVGLRTTSSSRAPRVSSMQRLPRSRSAEQRDVGVAQRRADQGAGDTGAPPERHGVLAAKVGPEVALAAGQLGPETASPGRGSAVCRSRAGGPRVPVPSPTKLPTSRPALSTRTSLASVMESSGVGARSGSGPSRPACRSASTPATSRVEATVQRDMAPNVTGAERVGKGSRSHVRFIHFARNLGSPQRVERQ